MKKLGLEGRLPPSKHGFETPDYHHLGFKVKVLLQILCKARLFFYSLSLKMLFEALFTASYQERPVFAECDFPGSFDGVVDGEDVVAVDPDG